MKSSNLEDLSQILHKNGVIQYSKENKEYFLSPECLPKSLDFDDVAIQQEKNICLSRTSVNTESEIIKGVKRNIPLIAANMSTVVNSSFINQLYKLGAFGIMHRALDDASYFLEIKEIAKNCEWVAASIGVGNNQIDLFKNLVKNGANIICIDIAHGYSDQVIEMAREIKKFSPTIKVIIGNTTNTNLLEESYKYIDACKIGVGQGLACKTKDTAGSTEKMISCILKFKFLSKELGIPIIADGGIRKPADFTKAIGAGASSVMAGSVFAACPESSAEIIIKNGEQFKVYSGMASREVQEKWRGLKNGTCTEGKTLHLPLGENLDKLVERYLGALRSGITYSGTDNLISFQTRCSFIRIN